MEYFVKAEMNGEVLAGELLKVAGDLAEFTVTPVLDMKGNLDAGQFGLTPKNDLGIDGLMGKTYFDPNSAFGELRIDVSAIRWPEDMEAAKNSALLSVFQPLVDAYNETHPSKAQICSKS